MFEPWVASAWLLTEEHFRKVVGFRDIWAVYFVLGRKQIPPPLTGGWRNINLACRFKLQLRLGHPPTTHVDFNFCLCFLLD